MNYILLTVISLFSFSVFSANCNQAPDNDSLWVKEFHCDDNTTISVGHELFNESLIVKDENNKTKQIYLYQDKDEVNKEFLKIKSKINN
jgi:hypothetical protein